MRDERAVEIPRLNYDAIRERVAEFRGRYGYDAVVYPIEWVIEKHLGLDIIPMPELLRTCGMGACLSPDRKEIRANEYDVEHDEPTYRFNLAHEVGHYELVLPDSP